METDPERAAELGRAMKGVLAHDTVRAWAWDVWSRLRHALEQDAVRPHGRTVLVIEDALVSLSSSLATDETTRARVNAAVQKAAMNILPAAQAELANFIGRVIGQWDTATITDKLELRIGKDLQYIRVNGTLVGFVLGASIYGLLILAHR
jgi:uncharacterized membrane-anchored protein YjiN (DUF445 family)